MRVSRSPSRSGPPTDDSFSLGKHSSGSSASLLPLLVVLGLGAVPLASHARGVEQPAPTLLVLGAAQYNGHPSPAFRRRLDHALALYKAGGVSRVIVSGGVGVGDTFSEGNVGVKYLAGRGVPKTRLKAETRSRSTLENVLNSKPFISGPVTLVTDEVHATRALALARGAGLNASVSSVPLASTGEAARRYRQREKLLLAAYTLFGLTDLKR